MNNQRLDSSRNVLVLEDDEYRQFFLSEIWKSRSTRLVPVSDLTEACDLVDEQDFDVVIINLGGFNRDETAVLNELRHRNAQIPVVVVSCRTEVDFATGQYS
jgi:DNA-binding response OmpR family regulator